MSNYTKGINFTAKDSLPSGNISKLIRGADFDQEFSAVATAIGTKLDSSYFANVDAAVTVTEDELNYLSGVSSNIQTQLTILSGDTAINTVSGTDIDCSVGQYYTKTINGNTTLTVSNVPAAVAYQFTMEITHTTGTITWWSGVLWPGDVTPTLTTGKTHLFMFVTDDGGTTWRGSYLSNYSNS